MANKLRYLTYMLRIRRVEFRVAEIPILVIPIFLVLSDLHPLRTFSFWEGIFIFFLLFAFGDMINCLADRDLDAVYKPHLSEAVYGLGVRFVTFQVIATAIIALGLAAHLSWLLQRWSLLVLVALGVLLGAAYSVQPIQLKGRGLSQVVCLWLIIFVGPMAFISMLVRTMPPPAVLIFAAAYGALQMGVILVNTAEDYPEDLEAKIHTSIVAVGLHRGISLAFWLAGGGATLAVAALVIILHKRGLGEGWLLALAPATVACIYVLRDIWTLKSAMAGQGLEKAIQTVKASAKKVPIWLTVVAWSMLAATFAIFLGTHN